MNGANSLEDFFEKNGYSCPVCYDPYDLTQRSKQPTLTCDQHNVCIECLTNLGKEWENCPTCRADIRFDINKINPNSQIITAMETIKSLWEQLNKVAPAAAPMPAPQPAVAAPVVVEQPKPLAIPENFGSLFPFQEIKKIRANTPDIASAFNKIIPVMNWQEVAGELRDDFKMNSPRWVALSDNTSKQVLGTAWLSETQSKGHWEIHWMGVTQPSMKDYVEFYKCIAQFVESQARNNRDDWKNYSLSSYYNYDTEEKWLNEIVDMLRQHNRRYDLVTIHRTWGTQRKLTLFPCRKQGHVQNNFTVEEKSAFSFNKDIADEARSLSARYLQAYKMDLIIKKLAVENGIDALEIFDSFTRSPESFYLYTSEGFLRGFIQFERDGVGLRVNRCCLLTESQKFADHFIREFMTVVRTQPTLINDVVAECVTYSASCYNGLRQPLRNAIDAAQRLTYKPL